MESEGSDKRQDILVALLLGPHTAAAAASPGSSAAVSQMAAETPAASEFIGFAFEQESQPTDLRPVGSFPHTRLGLFRPAPAELHQKLSGWARCARSRLAPHMGQRRRENSILYGNEIVSVNDLQKTILFFCCFLLFYAAPVLPFFLI